MSVVYININSSAYIFGIEIDINVFVAFVY